MACISPLIRVDSEKVVNSFYYRFLKENFHLKDYRGGFFLNGEKFFSMTDNNIKFRDSFLKENYVSLIPCGHCLSCSLKYSRDWSLRVAIESESFKFGYFLTLTYDEINVHSQDFITKDKEVINLAYLSKDDLQKFMKRLRKHFYSEIKFFACGEYGPTTARPHYHLIILCNDPINDLKAIANYNGNVFYESALLSSVWGLGFVSISDCNLNTIFYTSHYCLKKVGKPKIDLVGFNGEKFQNEFQLMSRRPGLASDFFIDKVVPNYLDLTTFKYKDFEVPIRNLKYFNYMFDKFHMWTPIYKEKNVKVKLFNDCYTSYYDDMKFRKNCEKFDCYTFRDMI